MKLSWFPTNGVAFRPYLPRAGGNRSQRAPDLIDYLPFYTWRLQQQPNAYVRKSVVFWVFIQFRSFKPFFAISMQLLYYSIYKKGKSASMLCNSHSDFFYENKTCISKNFREFTSPLKDFKVNRAAVVYIVHVSVHSAIPLAALNEFW